MSFPLDGTVSFGPYRLSARVATGGMAEVYAARRVHPDGRVGPLVAVKRLLPHLARDSSVVRMFLNEARITAQISHPNVVRVLEMGDHFGEPFIAMELLVGHSFADLRQRAADQAQRVPLGITLKVLTDACRGLDAAHRARDEQGRFLWIVHRDFTPDNVHVGVNGMVKVIDFGIAKAQNLGSGTEPGTLKGKFFYMSPEMIAGRPVDHRADLYAAGVMLYEQLCGRRPFTGTTPDEVLDRIAEARPRRPTEFDPSVPVALEQICLKALRQNPNDRFTSLQEFIAAIEAVGGAAEVAPAKALQRYLQRMYPEAHDPQVAAVQHAREIDPSLPNAALDAPIPESARTPKPRATVHPEVEGHDHPEPVAPLHPEPVEGPAKSRSRWPLWLGVTLAVIAIATGAGIVAWKQMPRLTAAQRLEQAENSTDRNQRASLLADLAQDPKVSAAQLSKAGDLLLVSGANAEALELSAGFQQRFPKSLDAKLLEAQACMALRQGRRAEAAIEAARTLEPKSPEPELVLADLKELQGDLPGATAALADALKKDPSSLKVARRQGYLLSQSGRLDEAEDALQTILRRRFDAEAASELAFVRYRQGRTGEALSLLKRALRETPKLARAHYYLGAVLYRQGDAKGAERAYREADELAPSDSRSLLALCELYAQTGRASELPGLSEQLQQRFPEDAQLLTRRCSGK